MFSDISLTEITIQNQGHHSSVDIPSCQSVRLFLYYFCILDLRDTKTKHIVFLYFCNNYYSLTFHAEFYECQKMLSIFLKSLACIDLNRKKCIYQKKVYKTKNYSYKCLSQITNYKMSFINKTVPKRCKLYSKLRIEKCTIEFIINK